MEVGGGARLAKTRGSPNSPGLLGEIWVPLKDLWEKGSDRNSGNCVLSCCLDISEDLYATRGDPSGTLAASRKKWDTV